MTEAEFIARAEKLAPYLSEIRPSELAIARLAQALREMYEAGGATNSGAAASDLVLRGLDILMRGGWSPNDRRLQDEHFERLTRDTRQWAIDLAALNPTQGA